MKLIARLRAATLLLAIALTPASAAAQTSGSVTYTYDPLGRIATATYDTGIVILYTYDANGNRTQQVINVNSATPRRPAAPASGAK